MEELRHDFIYEESGQTDQAVFVKPHDPPSGAAVTSKGWKLPVELICDWRWRCLGDGLSITGSELWFTNGNGGGLARLAESADKFVDRHDLRHDCGSPVLPVHAIDDER